MAANAILDLVGSRRRVTRDRPRARRTPSPTTCFCAAAIRPIAAPKPRRSAPSRCSAPPIARDSSFAEGWAGLVRAYAQANYRGYRIPDVPADRLVSLMLEASERALYADSTRSYVWVGRAVALREIEPTSRQAQLAALERAIALDSTNADAWYYIGDGVGGQPRARSRRRGLSDTRFASTRRIGTATRLFRAALLVGEAVRQCARVGATRANGSTRRTSSFVSR